MLFVTDLEIKFGDQFLRAGLNILLGLYRDGESDLIVKCLRIDLKIGVEFSLWIGLLRHAVRRERAAFINVDARRTRSARGLCQLIEMPSGLDPCCDEQFRALSRFDLSGFQLAGQAHGVEALCISREGKKQPCDDDQLTPKKHNESPRNNIKLRGRF